jgi:hypothetical protein
MVQGVGILGGAHGRAGKMRGGVPGLPLHQAVLGPRRPASRGRNLTAALGQGLLPCAAGEGARRMAVEGAGLEPSAAYPHPNTKGPLIRRCAPPSPRREEEKRFRRQHQEIPLPVGEGAAEGNGGGGRGGCSCGPTLIRPLGTFSHQGRRARAERIVRPGRCCCTLLPSWEKVPEGRMRGAAAVCLAAPSTKLRLVPLTLLRGGGA